VLTPIYQDPGSLLVEFNIRCIRAIANYLALSCRFLRSSHLKWQGKSDDRIISLSHIVGADEYLSGKGGQNYQDPKKFITAGVTLDVRAYDPIPYPQGSKEFVPGLSILDALFRLGKDSVHLLEYKHIVA